MKSRKKLQEAKNNREYNVILKNTGAYCIICNRRAGRFHAYCGPFSLKRKRNWKQFRKTQYKV